MLDGVDALQRMHPEDAHPMCEEEKTCLCTVCVCVCMRQNVCILIQIQKSQNCGILRVNLCG